MVRKIERANSCRGIGEKEGEGKQNCVMDTRGDDIEVENRIMPLLVDANQGARILGISLSHFYKFIRKNKCAQPITIGSLCMWKREDLLRFMGKPCNRSQALDDILIDAQKVAAICSVSRSMVYKMNEQGILPEPIMDGRTLRWSFQIIEEWIGNGCPPRRKVVRRKGRK